MNCAVELDKLSRRYGRHYVLREISLRIGENRIVVLQGSNGAGKTTLLRVLATTLRPSRGGGRIFGLDLVKQSAEVRQRVAYLGVLGGAYGTLTALENLRFAARLYGKKASLEAQLERVGLLEARDKPTRTFSSGMKKRLALARLLLADADLLLLDEPYAALDEAGKGLIDAVLREAKVTGKTVVMASHELERTARLADSVLRLEQGRLSPALLFDLVAGHG